MATITGLGIGSGIDINSLLEQIVEAEQAPTASRLNRKEAAVQAEISAFGTFKAAVDDFQSALGQVKTSSNFISRQVRSSNEDIITGTATSIAEKGKYSVEVSSLAKSHSLASVAFDSMDDIVGTGELTFSFGTTDYDPGSSFEAGDDTYNGFTANGDVGSETITIDSSNNTLAGIREAVNNADIGVTASIIDDGSGFRLLFTAEQGANKSLQVSVDEGGDAAANADTTGLSQLAFNADATNLEQTQAGSDAVFSVNGLTITRDSNNIVGAIQGVTLDLQKAEPGTTVQVNIREETGDIVGNIQTFVESYNSLMNTYSALTAYDPNTNSGGVLQGEATARGLITAIRRQVSTITSSSVTYTSLSSIGIQTNRDGTLEMDTAAVKEAIATDAEAVAKLFHPGSQSTNSNVNIISSSFATREGNYAVRIANLATQGQLLSAPVESSVVIDASNDSFSLLVDGVSSGSLTIDQATYNDLDVLAQEIQQKINSVADFQDASISVAVNVVGAQLQITSSRYGSESSVVVETENASLGLTASAIANDGEDVAGTIGGIAATGNGQQLTSSAAANGLTLEITGQKTGSLGSIFVSQGIAGRLDALISQFLKADGQYESKTDTLKDQIEDINTQRTSLAERVATVEARYRSQFEALDVLLGQLQSTGDYVTRQLDSLPGFVIGGNNKD